MSELNKTGETDLMNDRNPFLGHNNIRLTLMTDDYAEIEADITHDSLNIHNRVHGGVMMTMLDTVCGCASRSDHRKYVTLSCAVHFLSSRPDITHLIGRGFLIKRGGAIAFTRGEVWDDEHNLLVATCEAEYFCISQ